MAAEVFLGGSCNPTTWRKDIAMPALEKAGVTFYNPQVDDWKPELVAIEAEAKLMAPCLLFVIDSQTRSLASLVEAAEFIAAGRNVVLVIMPLPENATVAGEKVQKGECKDINRAREYLRDVAKRHGARVFESVQAAIDDIVQTKRTKGSIPKYRGGSGNGAAPYVLLFGALVAAGSFVLQKVLEKRLSR
eukprot:tig00020909_g15324.t1